MENVLFNVRLPRILLACMVGCSLSSAGAAYQGIFQNPMAAPDILGATAGAAFGAALAILNEADYLTITLCAFFFTC
jgi:iron complex transport system permease protein